MLGLKFAYASNYASGPFYPNGPKAQPESSPPPARAPGNETKRALPVRSRGRQPPVSLGRFALNPFLGAAEFNSVTPAR